MRKSDLVKWVKALQAHFPNAPKLTQENLQAYLSHLADYPDDVLGVAGRELAASETFFPAIATIRETCDDFMAKKKEIPDVGQAWANALEVTRKIGIYGNPREDAYTHPVVALAVRGIGGHRFMCDRGNTEPTRARFFELFRGYREDAIKEKLRPQVSRELAARYLDQVSTRALAVGINPGGLLTHPPRVHRATGPNRKHDGEVPGGDKAATASRTARPAAPQVHIIGDGMTDEEWTTHKAKLIKEASDGE